MGTLYGTCLQGREDSLRPWSGEEEGHLRSPSGTIEA